MIKLPVKRLLLFIVVVVRADAVARGVVVGRSRSWAGGREETNGLAFVVG